MNWIGRALLAFMLYVIFTIIINMSYNFGMCDNGTALLLIILMIIASGFFIVTGGSTKEKIE